MDRGAQEAESLSPGVAHTMKAAAPTGRGGGRLQNEHPQRKVLSSRGFSWTWYKSTPNDARCGENPREASALPRIG